ncbi:flavodoxin family protein [Metallumcola ferriviriculae]|uniref:Flavodoxin family protein n=1 Tax=Metallumcola ferriviriculae TaxID=3039180 RepID=A0AAU0UQE3_9FIRM|nr:flavodoxin family protein [Desulfitibacteraceae bacterium MK1]
MAKKILGFVGSKRRLGNSDVLVRTVLSKCADMEAEVEIIYLDELDIRICRGCLACAFKGACVQKDDMTELISKMLKADGLVIAAPTYLFSPSGIIKTMIDRALMMSSYLDEVDISRPAVSITVAGNKLWNPLGVEFLNQFCFAFGFSVIDYLEAYAPGPGEVTLNDDSMVSAEQLGVKLLDPEAKRRQPDGYQCPVCFSRCVRISDKDNAQCAFCLTESSIKEDRLEVKENQESFWTPDHRKRHLAEWIFVTKDRFMENRQQIKENLSKFRNK